MDIEIRLFGPVEVVTPSGRLSSSDFPSRKAKQVLQVLALAAGRVVSKDRLIDLLWRRRMPRNPAATVELAVSLLRSALATVTDAALVVTAPGGYRLDTALVDIDTGRFDELLQLSAESPADGRMTMLAEAVRLADRPLFEDELGAEWVVNDRERFRVKSQSAALGLGRQALAVDDATLAFSMAERAR
ncbi:MAG: winged helix-turn-helix domain-containing protein, partial [Actinomycetota bacterium]